MSLILILGTMLIVLFTLLGEFEGVSNAKVVNKEEPTVALEVKELQQAILSTTKQLTEVEERLAEVLYFECREEACSVFEQNLIIDTVLTRVEVKYRGDDVISVIEAPKQFSYLNGIETRVKVPNPTTLADEEALADITRLVRHTYKNYLYDNEDSQSYQHGVYKPIQYYNASKVKVTPSWVDPKCLIDTGNTLHKFYNCYKLK